MSGRRIWLAAGALVLVLAAALAGWRLAGSADRAGVRSAPGALEPKMDPGSPYRASDPALLAATGRPQLVEFYHRL